MYFLIKIYTFLKWPWMFHISLRVEWYINVSWGQLVYKVVQVIYSYWFSFFLFCQLLWEVMLKTPTNNVDLFISPFSIFFSFMYLESLLGVLDGLIPLHYEIPPSLVMILFPKCTLFGTNIAPLSFLCDAWFIFSQLLPLTCLTFIFKIPFL